MLPLLNRRNTANEKFRIGVFHLDFFLRLFSCLRPLIIVRFGLLAIGL